MAKRLKKKLEELCGLADLGWEERQARANEILSSHERKLKLCNQVTGLSFRELEQVLKGIASERQPKPDADTKRVRPQKSTKSAGVHKPRTIEEILKQVYGPRCDEDRSGSRSEVRDGSEFQGADHEACTPAQ